MPVSGVGAQCNPWSSFYFDFNGALLYSLPMFCIADGFCSIVSIRLRQLYMKVWTVLVVFLVVLHVSDPYSETDFTLELKILNLVSVAIALAIHVFFLSWMKATLASPIRALTSASVPP